MVEAHSGGDETDALPTCVYRDPLAVGINLAGVGCNLRLVELRGLAQRLAYLERLGRSCPQQNMGKRRVRLQKVAIPCLSRFATVRVAIIIYIGSEGRFIASGVK